MHWLTQLFYGIVSAAGLLMFVGGSVGSMDGRGGEGAAIGGAIIFVGTLFCTLYVDQHKR